MLAYRHIPAESETAVIVLHGAGSHGESYAAFGHAMAGLGAETLLSAPIAIAYLASCEIRGTGALRSGAPSTWLLLILSGALTALPLWLFAYGARRVRYSTVGVMQYIGPTISLAIGVAMLHEPFPFAKAAGFMLIWLGLVIYAVDGFLNRDRPD